MSHHSARIHKLKKLVVPLPCFFILGTCLYLSYAAILLAPNGVSTTGSRLRFWQGSNEAVALKSLRIEVSGQSSGVYEVFTALHVLLPLKTSKRRCFREVKQALISILPDGVYKITLYITGGCFTREWLRTDAANAVFSTKPKVCMKPTVPSVHTLVVRNDRVPTLRQCSPEERFRVGYWLNKSWVTGGCKTEEVRLKSQLFIHMAGDSVARNMLGIFCRKINATRTLRVLDERKKVKFSHCCDEAKSRCIFFRMTWFPRDTFSPSYVFNHFRTKEMYCSHFPTDDVQNCLQNTPALAFPFDKSGATTDAKYIWHWLFYGSHSPALGASKQTCAKFEKMSSGQNVISFGTPAVRAELIPNKYANQRHTRTNERIAALNELLDECKGNSSFLDLFPASFARPKTDFSDAIHMTSGASLALAELIWSSSLSLRSLPLV